MGKENYVKKLDLKPGDEIVVPKSNWNFIQHHAIYIGYDRLGTHWIIDNNVNEGVRLITVDTFFSQVIQINAINRFKGTNDERKALVKKALASIGQPYSLIDFNCQHFTSEILTGKRESYQVQNIAAVAIITLFIGLFVSEA